jgi:glycosyltransferase involved in cell wall biosynthesis
MLYVNTRFLYQKTTGVQRYAKNILAHFPNYQSITPPSWASKGVKGHLWEQSYLPLQIKKNDLLWSPTNTGPLYLKQQVITIHDLSWLEHPEWFKKSFALQYRFIASHLVKNCRHILTISKYTKEKIIEHYKIDEKKISVIYCGIDIIEEKNLTNTFSPKITSLEHDKPFLLFVGSIEPRKNIKRLLQAWKITNQSIQNDYNLVIVGSEGKVFKEQNINFNESHIKIFGYVSDSELVYLYKKASALIYPSLYEGFGLPPLEAMKYGLPVISSNVTALPEAVGDSALMCDPYSVEDIANKINDLLENETLQKELTTKGFEQIKKFSWKNTSESTYDILSSLQ